MLSAHPAANYAVQGSKHAIFYFVDHMWEHQSSAEAEEARKSWEAGGIPRKILKNKYSEIASEACFC